MKRICLFLTALLLTCMAVSGRAETVENPAAVTALLDRIGGQGASGRFVTIVDDALSTNGKDVFVITASGGKPCIKGSSVIAVTTGINWYLNHTARINLAWNCLTTDLNTATLPVPAGEERHTCDVDYRYYLNYCTYSYSCAMWTEERWMQEIDWMALHGINMPLMLVGLDVIWHDIYTGPEFGYTTEEIGKYIAGPAFQAWWGMTNLEGHGGPNPKWWYERQRAMCRNMLARMRQLGMEPVLPGFYGTVPSNLATKMAGKGGYTQVNAGGNWQGYKAPGMLSATDPKFDHLAEVFYETQKKVMGESRFFSMDLCHEGGTAPNCGRATQAKGIVKALDTNCGPQSVWVIQAWGGNPADDLLGAVPKGRLLVLDLFAENTPRWGRFGQHDFVYCMLLNFGGRTGLHGRYDNLVDNYKNVLRSRPSQLKGVGATPEGIENNPVMYDAFFELPWTDMDKKGWVKEYATARYGKENAVAQGAMEKLMGSVYNCPGGQQGTSEPVVLAQPSLTVRSVSTWSTSSIPYDHTQVISAAGDLLSQAAALEGNNFEYDLLDVTRQALSDYAYYLLAQLNSDYQKGGGTSTDFRTRKDWYLTLIDDLDELLGSHHSYRLGNWTEMARAIVTEPAAQAAGATQKDADWLEYDNLRRQVSTWSDFNGSLREYSNREWNGMLKDYYKPRWTEYLNALANGSGTGKFTTGYWYDKGCEWVKNKAGITYTSAPAGDTKTLAAEKFAKYFFPVLSAKGKKVYVQRHIAQELKAADFSDVAYRGKIYTFAIPEGTTATLAVDANKDGNITDDERAAGNTITIPADAVTSDVKAVLTVSDGTVLEFRLALMDEILTDRTVSVAVAESCKGQGSVGFVGAAAGTTSVTGKEAVSVLATPAKGFDFAGWTLTAGGTTQPAGTENPLPYYGAADAAFTASFVENIWGIPAQEAADEMGTIREVNSWLSAISCTQDETTTELYSAGECPDQYFNPTPGNVNAARGSSFTISMKDAGGMGYCYLSAYIDLNRDGDFDDEGELVEVRGTKNAHTSGICDAPLRVILPYDMPAGLTHLRLRFDGAWKGNISATGGAVPAKADLTRMTYEIPVNVSEYAAGTTHVIIKSSDETLGTVRNITGTSGEDISVPSGTEIQPEAFPKEDCEFVHWTDQYGRIVSTQSAFKIKPAENSVFTAVFKKKSLSITAGDFILNGDETASGNILISGIQSGKGTLDLTATDRKVTGIMPDALRGNTAIEHIMLPARDIALDYWTRTNFKGAGTSNAAIVPATTIPGAGPWKLTMRVSTDGSAFNQWGSGLLATGSNALADSYQNNFQFYLSKSGNLTMKLNNGDNRYAFSPAVGNTFTIEMVNDGAGNFSTILTAENGQTDTKTQTGVRLDDITQFCTALPKGVNIDLLEVTDPTLHSQPLKGCSALTDITVPEGHATLSDRDGILCSAAGDKLRAYPEGRLTTRLFRLRSLADGKVAYAAPLADANGNMKDGGGSDRRVLAGDFGTTPEPASLWQLVRDGSGYKVEHINSRRFFGGKAGGHDRVEMPVSATQWHGVYAYDGNVSADGDYVLTLKLNDYYVKNDGEKLMLETTMNPADEHRWAVEEATDLTVEVSDALWTAVCLPADVLVPPAGEATVYMATEEKGDVLELTAMAEGTALKAGEGVLVHTGSAGDIHFPLTYGTEAALLTDNLLDGALLQRTGLQPETFYGLGNKDGVGFYLSVGTIVPANKAFLKKEKTTGAVQAFRFGYDSSTGIGNFNTEETTNGKDIYYDLKGRRVFYPSHGIYVKGNGEKVYIR